MSKEKETSISYNMFPHGSFKQWDFTDKDDLVNLIVRHFLAQTLEMFEYKGLPKSIPARTLELYLQLNGYAAIAKHDGVLYPLRGGLGGKEDVYYMPEMFIPENPNLPALNKNLKIGVDCVVIPSDKLYSGLRNKLRLAATQLADNIISLRIAQINSRLTTLVSAADANVRAAAEKYFNDVINGKMCVAADNSFITGLKVQPYANAGSANVIRELVEFQQYIKASLYNDLGINANFNMKREALNSSESSLNDSILRPFVDDMLESRRDGLKAVNDLYGTNITVDFGSCWAIQAEEDERELKDPEEDERELKDPEEEGNGKNEE